MSESDRPLGAVLAGGRGRRLGQEKACAELAGRPLVSYPLAALSAVLDDVVLVAKRTSVLPALDVPVWIEPDEPRHPLTGIVYALRRAGGRSVVICAADMPLVTSAVVAALAEMNPRHGTAVLARAQGRAQPLLGRYDTGALERLERAPPDRPLSETVALLEPSFLDVADEVVSNVNTADDVARLTARLRVG